MLDVCFHKEASFVHDMNASVNLSLLRKIALASRDVLLTGWLETGKL